MQRWAPSLAGMPCAARGTLRTPGVPQQGRPRAPGQELARGLLCQGTNTDPRPPDWQGAGRGCSPHGRQGATPVGYGGRAGAGTRRGPQGGMPREAAGCGPALALEQQDELMCVPLPAPPRPGPPAMRSGPRHGPIAPAGAPSTGQRETEAPGSFPAQPQHRDPYPSCAHPSPPGPGLRSPRLRWPPAPLALQHPQPSQRPPGLGGERSRQLQGGLSPGSAAPPARLPGRLPASSSPAEPAPASPGTQGPRPAPQHPGLIPHPSPSTWGPCPAPQPPHPGPTSHTPAIHVLHPSPRDLHPAP